MNNILVNGVVAARDKQPYLHLDIDGHVIQLTMAEARNIARDIETTCARTEADAMIHKFFSASGFPEQAGGTLMLAFREFRANLDDAEVKKFREDSDA